MPGEDAMTRPHPCMPMMHGLLTWVVAWWAIILALPFDTFSSSKSYRLFAEMASETLWAFGFACVAGLGVAGMMRPRLRLLSAHILAITHVLIAAFLCIPNPAGTGTGIYGGFALLAFYFLWRTGTRGTGNV